ncbi:MAG TPA: malto-oligosyltrehalose trehalohydrolase [Polyangiales bacterium]|nr:malto-oligosyltrehalose trehalohydrolase [Polyangiales bacterium]
MNPAWKIWAPKARELEVVVNGRPRPAERQADGSWRADTPPLEADYQLRIDGQLRPDPRSRFQPDGVHGPSRWVADEYAWHDESFRAVPLSAAVIYELHVGTFTPEGTFQAAIARLPHLKQLGVTHVELMPVAAFPGRQGWGYDGVALYAPHAAYGSPRDLKRLVAACHELGLAAILDVVYNHLGPDGNYLGEFGPYFSERHKTPWGAAVNLDDAGSDEARRFFIDNARMWLREYHFDGLRLDAVHALYDQSAVHFLEQLASEVAELSAALHKPLCVIAESDLNDPRLVRSRDAGGYGLCAQWSDDFHHAVHSLLTGEQSGYYADFGSVELLARTLKRGYAYDGTFSEFRGRSHGRPLGEVSGHRLLGYIQNHDQIGNRARGERIGHLVSPGKLRIGAALVFTAPFVPMLFQGEEWNASAPFQYFTDHQDPKLAEAVRQGRRAEFAAFGWTPEDVPDPQDAATFRRSVLDWTELERPQHAEVLAWYSALARLRAQTPELLDGRFDRVSLEWDESKRYLVMQRGPITLQANFGESPVVLPRPNGQPVLSFPEQPTGDASTVALAPDGCSIWRA